MEELLSMDELEKVSGGMSAGEHAVLFSSVKCPVNGCGFECSSFGELNVHMRTCHTDRIRK